MLTNVQTIIAHPENVSCVTFSPDGTLLATGSAKEGAVKLWDAATLQEKALLRTLASGVHTLRFFPSGQRLFVCGGNIWLMDVTSGDALDYFEVAANTKAVALPDEQRFVSYGFDGRLRVWDVANSATPVFESKKTIKGYGGPLDCSPNGRFCALGTTTAVSLWDLLMLKEIYLLRGHKKEVRDLAFSPDSAILASGGKDGKILLWDVRNGSLLREINTPKGQEVWSLTFLGAGHALAGSSYDVRKGAGMFAIWDTRSRQLVDETEQGRGTPQVISASPDGKRIAAAYGDFKQVKMWS